MSKPQFQETVELRDGSEVLLRPIEPEDATRLQDLFSRLSQDSIYMRFLEFRKELSLKEAQRFAEVDYQGNMAIVAALPTEGDLIGVARYGETIPPRPGVVDAAVVVQDDYQGRGLGTLLLLRLVEYAREHGVEAMHATVHQSNAQIMRFITKSGLPTERKLAGGVWDITVSLADIGNLPSH
ncbi:MAG: GNAT family N-acetyltransferase [Anaerolineales bacterium]